MAADVESVVKQLTESGVISPGKLEGHIPPKADPKNVDEFVAELVKSGNLTPFQAQHVKAGKAKALVLGNYTILDKIGAGGMGQVFKAVHRKMERLVAIKMLPPKMTKDAAALARFQREVVAAARLRHPNIVAADDAAEANGAHFLVMEYVDGKDLSATVKRGGPLTVDKAVNYILQAARGLEFAHAEGVIHRDIKPSNLLLDKKGVVKILDMGLARLESTGDTAAQAELTGTGAVMGTVDYMAPEQALNTKHADQRSDVYSLGISLFYLLSGKAAYGGESVMEKLLAHREQPIPSLVDIQPGCPKQLDVVFHKMVAKRPGDRFQTMGEVATALESLRGQLTEPAARSAAVHSPPAPGNETSDATAAWQAARLPSIPSSDATLPGPVTKKKEGPRKPPSNRSPSNKPRSAAAGGAPPWKNTKVLAAAGAAGFLLVLLGVWVVIKDKSGKVVSSFPVPDGGTVVVENKADGVAKTADDATPEKVAVREVSGQGKFADGVAPPSNPVPPSASPPATDRVARWPFDPSDGREYEWSEPESVGPAINTADGEVLWSISQDERTMFFVRTPPGTLHVSRRERASDPWSEPTKLPSMGGFQLEGSITDDGQLLFGAKKKADKGGDEVWTNRWSGEPKGFANPSRLPPPVNIGSSSTRHPIISPDALTLLATSTRKGSQSGDIWMFTRPAIDQPFSTVERLAEPVNTSDWDMPSFVSNDRLFVIAGSQRGSDMGSKKDAVREYRYFTRAKASDPFGPGRPLGSSLLENKTVDSNGSFRLGDGGRALYFHSRSVPGGAGKHDIWVTRRVPKELPTSGKGASIYLDQLQMKSFTGWAGTFKPGLNAAGVEGFADYFQGETPPEHALATHPSNDKAAVPLVAELTYELPGAYDRFQAQVRKTPGRVSPLLAEVWGDGKKLWESGNLVPLKTAGAVVDLDIRGVHELKLVARAEKHNATSQLLWVAPRLTPAVPGNASAASSPSIAKLLTSYDYQWTEPEALSKIVNFALYNFCPRVSDDGLEMWFSANGGKAAADPGLGSDELWITRRKSLADPWEKPVNAGAPINSGKSEKDFTLTADRLQIIWYRSLYLQLSSRAALDKPWSDPVRAAKDNYGHYPVFSPDGLTLFYSRGTGKDSPREHEIFVCTRPSRDESFSPSVVLPEPINSAKNDHPCWISADGTVLIFSSDRESGLGKMDLWFAIRARPSDPWQEPKNLGSPINTAADEVNADLAPDGRTLWFHSARDGQKIYQSRLVAKASVAAAAEPRWPYDPPDGREYAWGEPENLGRGVNYGKRDLNPRLTADELTLIYNRGTELFTARRSSRDESFGQCELLSGPVQSVGSETSSLTGDGLELYLGSSTSDRHIWVSTRSSIEKPFGEPVKLGSPVNSSHQDEYPIISSDGLTLAITSGRPDPSKSASSDVYLFRRRSRAEPFGGATNLGRDVNIAKMITPNWISSDGLVLFSTVMKKQPWLYLWHARRSTDDPFSPGVPFGEPFVGPIGPGGAWLSLDGRRMYFHSRDIAGGFGDLDLWMARRVPKSGTVPVAAAPATP